MCGKYSLTKFASFLIIVLRTEIATTFKAESEKPVCGNSTSRQKQKVLNLNFKTAI